MDKPPVRVTVTFVRPENDMTSTVAQIPKDQRSETVFQEFTETWEKDAGDEAALTKRLISRVPGRKLTYVDHQAMENNPLTDDYVTVFNPYDFTVHRLKPV